MHLTKDDIWIVSKCRKRFSIICNQGNTIWTIRHYYVFNRMGKILKTDDSRRWQICGIGCCRECKMVYPLWKTVAISLWNDPLSLLLGMYPRDIKKSRQIFIETLFIIVQHWKKPKCLPTGEWLKQNVVYPLNGKLLEIKVMDHRYMQQHE